MKPKTLTELAAMGGRASWKNVNKEERSKRMKKLASKRWNKARQDKVKSVKSAIPTS